MLWGALRRSSLGSKVRRQVPIGPFIADFYWPRHKLVIEVDGGEVHADRQEYDQRRTRWLRAHGYHVIRFEADEVLIDVEEVRYRLRVAVGEADEC
jgi:very-short-patch-repair endonuclease